MAQHLDLEEQEQLAEIKHFWSRYGNLITWVLIAVFGAVAAWNGWQYWQRTQAVQASALFDEVERASQAGDIARVERAFTDLRDKYGRTVYAQQAGLLAAKSLVDKGNVDGARAALSWVAASAGDEAYPAAARLRLAGLQAEAKSYDDALKTLSGAFPVQFEPLAADRRGDVYLLQGKKDLAKAEYLKAYQAFDERSDYRRLLEVKLTSLGVEAKRAPGGSAAAGAAKP